MPKPRRIEPVDVNGKTQYRVEGDTQPQLYPTRSRAERRSQALDNAASRNDRPLGGR